MNTPKVKPLEDNDLDFLIDDIDEDTPIEELLGYDVYASGDTPW